MLERQSVFAIALDGARDYAAAKDTTSLCQPIATDVAGTTRCDTRIIGAPTASRKGTLTLDFRHVFTTRVAVPATRPAGGGEPVPSVVSEQARPVVGLSVQAFVQAVEHDKTIVGVSAPIYFLQKKAEANAPVSITGGATIGVNSKDGFVVQVFIGTAFSLFGKDISK